MSCRTFCVKSLGMLVTERVAIAVDLNPAQQPCEIVTTLGPADGYDQLGDQIIVVLSLEIRKRKLESSIISVVVPAPGARGGNELLERTWSCARVVLRMRV